MDERRVQENDMTEKSIVGMWSVLYVFFSSQSDWLLWVWMKSQATKVFFTVVTTTNSPPMSAHFNLSTTLVIPIISDCWNSYIGVKFSFSENKWVWQITNDVIIENGCAMLEGLLYSTWHDKV